MGSLKNLRVDTVAIVEGIWHPIVEDIQFKIARWRNPKFTELLAKLVQDKRTELKTPEGDDLPEAVSVTIVLEVMAETVLTDWKNLQGDDGKDLPYSKAKALELLTDEGMIDTLDKVKALSMNQEAYRVSTLEKRKGN